MNQNLNKSSILLFVYYFFAYLPIFFKPLLPLIRTSGGNPVAHAYFITTYIAVIFFILPLILWLRWVSGKIAFSGFFKKMIYCTALALPIAHYFRIGFFLMGHYEINLYTFMASLPFALIISIVFGFLSTELSKFLHYLKMKK